MSYNFDPDRWLENELRSLETVKRLGKITRRRYEQTADTLIKKHADMWDRLDGSYQIPENRRSYTGKETS